MKSKQNHALLPTRSRSPQPSGLLPRPLTNSGDYTDPSLQPSLRETDCACEGGCPHCVPETTAPASWPEVSGTGQPLAQADRDFFEQRLGEDFSQVRVHADAHAQQLAGSLHARAFTLGHDIVFGQGEYAPQQAQGRRLLAHELAHVIQQCRMPGLNQIQATFLPSELITPTGTAAQTNPIATEPATYFYAGSATLNPTGRRALVIGGLHGDETSAGDLGERIQQYLDTGGRTDFHVVVIPCVNPGTHRRQAGTDLNREYGQGYRSTNIYAAWVTDVVNEFDPERILSIHCIGASQGGIFLDPLHTPIPSPGMSPEDIRMLDRESYPDTSRRARADVFAGDERNVEAMHLTEGMIRALGDETLAPGNRERRRFPRSRYPASVGGESPYSLLYPNQGRMRGGISLGEWGSAHGRTVVTIELPGNVVSEDTLNAYMNAAQDFLVIASSTPGAGTP